MIVNYVLWFTAKIDPQKILILLYKQQFIFNTIKKNVTYKTGECNTGSVKNIAIKDVCSRGCVNILQALIMLRFCQKKLH
jgi:hypothetical protein